MHTAATQDGQLFKITTILEEATIITIRSSTHTIVHIVITDLQGGILASDFIMDGTILTIIIMDTDHTQFIPSTAHIMDIITVTPGHTSGMHI